MQIATDNAISGTVGASDTSAVVRHRYDYYVAQYEVVLAVKDFRQQLDNSKQVHTLSIQNPHQTSPLPAAARLLARTLSAVSASLSPTSSEIPTYSSPEEHGTSSSSDHHFSSLSSSDVAETAETAIPSPTHIAELQSTWLTAPTIISSVTDLAILGEGSSGVVYRGIYRGVACVVKLPKSISLTGAAWREWQMHLHLPPHPNLVHFLGALPMAANNYLVLGFVRQGNLHALLRCHASFYSRPYAVMRCMRDVSAVLHHIHSAGIVHRDVSCRNILVDSDGSMVLADLGLAEQQQQPSLNRHTSGVDGSKTAVPVRWTSPESLQTQRYDAKSDVWSLGVALWECTTHGDLPYREQWNTKACIQPIVAGTIRLLVDDAWGTLTRVSEVEQQLAERVRRLIHICLTHDVQQRVDSQQLVELVGREWQQWQAEAGTAAATVERELVAYHEETQRRLGRVRSSSAGGVGR